MLLNEAETKLDPRVIRTRQLLQDALLALMAEKSFQSITVQEIAERATVNRVTFYAHFADKQALLEYSIRQAFKARLHSRLPPDAPYSEANLRLLIQIVCEFLGEMNRQCPPPHGQFEPLMEKQIKAELYEVLFGWLAEASRKNGGQRPARELAAMVASWAIYGAATQWTQKDKPEPPQEFARQAVPLILAGMQTPR